MVLVMRVFISDSRAAYAKSEVELPEKTQINWLFMTIRQSHKNQLFCAFFNGNDTYFFIFGISLKSYIIQESTMELEEKISNKEMCAFSVKAIVAGLIGVLLIAGGSKFCPTLAKQSLLEHQLGIGIYFYFFLICLVWNPLCTKFIPKLAFNIKEIAVTMVMTLTAGGFAWFGWMKQFETQAILMGANGFSSAGWETYKIKQYVNTDALPNNGTASGTAGEAIIGRFINGGSNEKDWIPFTDIPFSAWSHTLLYWGVLILLVAFMCLALLLIVHRQWVRNEKLTYPLATVAESLIRKKSVSDCFAELFHSKMFWIVFGFIILIHGYNFAVVANPTSGFLKINLTYPLSGLAQTFPIIGKAGCSGILGSAKIMFLIIGISYFLAPALSLSVGLNGFVYLIFAAQVYETTGAAPTAQELQIFRAGAYLAFVIMLVILGRHYYGSIMWKAISWAKVEDEDKPAVLGARLFLITGLGTVLMLTMMGMDLVMAVSTTLILIIVYLVFTRIVCEAGIPMMVSPFMPVTFFSKMFGGAALGPENLMASGQNSGVFFGDMKQLMMPYLATGMKLSSDAGIRIRRIAAIVSVTILLAFAVAFGMHLWQYYSMGISDPSTKTTGWSTGVNEAVAEIGRLSRNEQLTEPVPGTVTQKWIRNLSCSGLGERIKAIEPEKINFFVYFILGLVAVFITGFLRTRFLWWPFHAVLFCIWGIGPANYIWFSFLLGWFLRTLIVRIGGEKNYVSMKPLFLGLIFGEIAASGLILIFGLIYYLIYKVPTTIIYQV